MITETILTESHLEKLLEMCKKLFPEYDDRKMYEFPSTLEEKMNQGKIWFHTRLGKFEAGIHWYELCLTYLFDRIFDPEDASMHYFQWSLFSKALQQENHPVEYLYRLFKTFHKN